MSKSTDARLALGRDAVVAPTVAATWLPGARADELRWLRARGLVRSRQIPDEDGRTITKEYVIWGEVLAELDGTRKPDPPARRPRGGTLRYLDPEG
jgi:hypothetical protein